MVIAVSDKNIKFEPERRLKRKYAIKLQKAFDEKKYKLMENLYCEFTNNMLHIKKTS